jgi:hypothetical protein
MKAPKITMMGACERDLDLLLTEELSSSEPFLSWFLNRLGLPSGAVALQVGHSVSGSNGESDLELTVQVNGALHKVLIEDKVDALFQPRQPERYRERAEGYVRSGTFASAVTVLVAPQVYIDGSADALLFDHRLSLEDLRTWFADSPDVGLRREYKCTLLTQTIERGASGWALVPDEACTSFWREYWRLASELAPELEMREPKLKPAGSTFVGFRPTRMTKHHEIVHKLPFGNVDLQFAGMGGELAAFRVRYRDALEPGMVIDKAAKSAVVRLKVPTIDTARPFSDAAAAAEQGVLAAAHLLQWFRRHVEPA